MTLAFRDPSIPPSPLARWDPRWKLAAILLAIFGTVALHTPVVGGVELILTLILAFVSRIPSVVIGARLGILLVTVSPFVIIVPLTQPATDQGWDLGFVHVSIPGILAAVVMTLRVLTVGLWILILTRTTPLHQLLAAAHALRIPGLFVQVTQLAYRYIFLFAAEARRLRLALRTRGFRPSTNQHTYRTLGYSIGSLLVRGGDRAERVADAMRCRGFDGTYRTLTVFQTTSADALSFLFLLSGTIAVILIDRLAW